MIGRRNYDARTTKGDDAVAVLRFAAIESCSRLTTYTLCERCHNGRVSNTENFDASEEGVAPADYSPPEMLMEILEGLGYKSDPDERLTGISMFIHTQVKSDPEMGGHSLMYFGLPQFEHNNLHGVEDLSHEKLVEAHDRYDAEAHGSSSSSDTEANDSTNS